MSNIQQQSTSITKRRAWSIPEACAIYGVSKGFLRQRIRDGHLPARKVGRRVLILDADLVNFFESGKASR